MSNLGLSNSLVASKSSATHILIDEDFESGTGGFTFIATTGSNDTERLKTIASGDATDHYAYKILVCFAYTTYNYSIDLAAIEHPSGGHIWIGISQGNNSHINHDTPSVATYTGSFTTGNETAIVLHLVGDRAGNYTIWDNILIEESK
tara:strand:+ start:760 stop:1203 length:444 start_codon:yes stop_codon:yes gene_type:complete